MNDVDIARFTFDFDTTWSAFFCDSKLRVYSQYGGRDERGADSRIGKASLITTMQEVLDAHEQQKEATEEEALRLFQPEPKEEVYPDEIPLLRENHDGCLHCHQIQEYKILQSAVDKRFRKEDFFGDPLPERLGWKTDFSHGHRIAEILADSAAERAGFQAGDVVVAVNGTPVRSDADFRRLLGTAHETEPLKLDVSRKTGRVQIEVTPDPDWKSVTGGWRKSVRSLPVEWGFLGYALGKEERGKYGQPEGKMAIRVISIRGSLGLAQQIGLKKEDVILQVGDDSTDRSIEELRSFLLEKFNPGDVVTMKVRRAQEEIELKGTFPDWKTNVTIIP